MTFKNKMYLITYISLPVILILLKGALGHVSKYEVGVGGFVLPVMIGALITSVFYAQFLKMEQSKRIVVGVFGIAIPILHLILMSIASNSNTGGDNVLSLLFITGLVALLEGVLYLGIFLLSIYDLLRYKPKQG